MVMEGCYIRKALDQAELMFDLSALLFALIFRLFQLGLVRILFESYLCGMKLGVSSWLSEGGWGFGEVRIANGGLGSWGLGV